MMHSVAIKLRVNCRAHMPSQSSVLHEVDADEAARFLELLTKYGTDEGREGTCIEELMQDYRRLVIE